MLHKTPVYVEQSTVGQPNLFHEAEKKVFVQPRVKANNGIRAKTTRFASINGFDHRSVPTIKVAHSSAKTKSFFEKKKQKNEK